MKWLRVPVMIVLLMPGCSLMVKDEDYYDGAWKSAGAAGMRPDSTAGNSSGTAGSAGEENAAGGAIGAAGDPGSGGTTNNSGGAAPTDSCDKPQCVPNEVDTAKQSCGACNTGQQTRTRKCSADTCTWGAWSAWSACGGVTATCTPGQTSDCANGDDCGQRVCSTSCSWGACAPKAAAECLRIGPGHTDQGSNFRCCGDGKWEFCLPTCHWSTMCEACGSECSC